jgi:general stress protein 26
MGSINRNQPEHNREDLAAVDAIARIRKMVEASPNCFFCTAAATGESVGVRPMNVRKVEDDGSLWFLSASDSQKNRELALDNSVTLLFQGSPHSDFLYLRGRAQVSNDPACIDELWESILATWFTEGKDDPRITVIRVLPTDGYYWDTKHCSAISGIKMMIGAAIGKTLDDSIEGRLRV